MSLRFINTTQPALPHIGSVAALVPAPCQWPDLPEPDLSGLGWYGSANEAREKAGQHADELTAAMLRDILALAHRQILRLHSRADLRDAPTLEMLRDAADALLDVDANTALYHLTRIAEEREWICQERGL